MIESLCLAGMLFGNLWETAASDPQKTPVTGAATAPKCNQPVRIPPPPLNSARSQMSITDVVQLAQGGTPDDIIIHKINATGSIFNLTTHDIQYLQDQNVSSRVISAMQAPYHSRYFPPAPGFRYPPGERVPVIEACDRPAPPPPPAKPVARPSCDEPPDLQKILRALPSMPRGLPYVYDVFRDDVEVNAEKLVDRVDPPCFFPLIGLAQLHHCHWKCTVTFTEHVDVAFPCPFQIKRRRSEVLYIDRDHLRLCMASSSDDGRNANSESCPGGRFAGKEIRKDSAKSPSDKQQLVSPPAGARYDTPVYPKQAFEPLVCPSARDQHNVPMSLSDVVRM